jgi:prolipoprotein diacylglyceryltransferase
MGQVLSAPMIVFGIVLLFLAHNGQVKEVKA